MFISFMSWLYFSFCANNSLHRVEENTYTKFNLFKSRFDLNETQNTGLDERVNKMTDIIDGAYLDYELLSRIDENFYKKNLLETLQNEKIPILQKMNALNRYLLSVHEDPPVNILAGGLLDDWEFDIEL